MSRMHVVKGGETLAKIAKQHGLRNWRAIYDHPRNAAFRTLRSNPNVIHPGDRIFVPDLVPKYHSGNTDRKHTFVLKSERHRLRLRLRNRWGAPLVGYSYHLSVANTEFEGQTDSDGGIDVPIMVDTEEGVLTAWLVGKEGEPTGLIQWRVRLGHLDPEDTPTGVQGRLLNLGFDVGKVDGRVGPRTRRALREFQGRVRLRPHGETDDATRSRLKEKHEGT